MPRRQRKMRGGFLDSLENTLSGWGTSISQGASNLMNKTKNALSSTPTTSTYMPTSATTYPPTSATTYPPAGGKRRRMRGGNGVATNAASISNIKTAEPHNLVGGKTKKQRHRKSCTHRKSYKH